MSYEFIEPLTEKPRIKKKAYGKISLGEKIIKEFHKVNVKYAKVDFGKLKGEYKSTISAARAMGRLLNGMNLKGQISVYSDENNVYLERTR